MEILSIIVSSSLIATILTSFINFKIQQFNYKKEFYKKLIDKRFAAHEQVVKLVIELKIKVQFKDNKICNRIFANGEDYLNNVLILIVSTVNDSLWLSNELNKVLLELNIFLITNVHDKIDRDNPDITNQIQEVGIVATPRISNFMIRIEDLLYKDFSEMENIRKFLKSKKMVKIDD